MKNTLCSILIAANAIASPLSDKLMQVKDYLAGAGFEVQENQDRYFTSQDYNLPLLMEESDANISAGMKDMLIAIDTVQDNGKRQAVEDNLGLYLVIGANTNPDSVYQAVMHEPSTKIIRDLAPVKHGYSPKSDYNLLGQKIKQPFMHKDMPNYKLYRR